MKKWYVYELVNEQGYVEDVGETTRPNGRMHDHINSKPGYGNGKWYGRKDLNMNIVKEFDNISAARRLETQLKIVHGLQPTEMIRNTKNGRKTGLLNGKTNGMTRSKPVIVFNIDGTFVGEYPSVRECARSLDIGHLVAVLKGRSKSTKGYVIKYKT